MNSVAYMEALHDLNDEHAANMAEASRLFLALTTEERGDPAVCAAYDKKKQELSNAFREKRNDLKRRASAGEFGPQLAQ